MISIWINVKLAQFLHVLRISSIEKKTKKKHAKSCLIQKKEKSL